MYREDQCHPVYDYDGNVKGSQGGRMHSSENAFQRAAQTPSLFPLPQKGFAFGVGVAFGVALSLTLLLHDLELAVA